MLFKNYRRVFKLIWQTNLFCMSSIPQRLTPALTSLTSTSRASKSTAGIVA